MNQESTEKKSIEATLESLIRENGMAGFRKCTAEKLAGLTDGLYTRAEVEQALEEMRAKGRVYTIGMHGGDCFALTPNPPQTFSCL